MSILGRARIGSDKYDEFMSTHEPNCDINHQGAAGSLATVGLVVLFSSVRKRLRKQLGYINYFGDGDSKSFS